MLDSAELHQLANLATEFQGKLDQYCEANEMDFLALKTAASDSEKAQAAGLADDIFRFGKYDSSIGKVPDKGYLSVIFMASLAAKVALRTLEETTIKNLMPDSSKIDQASTKLANLGAAPLAKLCA